MASLKSYIPINKVVSAAMADSYSDISKSGVYQLFLHWAARGFRKLNNEVLKTGVQKAVIYINPNTKTGTLPCDFGTETFVGVINRYGEKVPIPVNASLTDTNNIEDLSECIDRCEKCNQDRSVCSELEVTEDTTIVVINDENYEQTVIKKLYPNGDYYLETRIPVLNLETDVVEWDTQKEFIAKLSLKPCGCIEETQENIEIIRCNCYEVYCSHYAPRCGVSMSAGYQIFEETGLIKFNANFPFNKVYIEYRGYIPKKNGQYVIPEAAFETLVEYIKFKEIDGKPNISLSDKNWRLERFKAERKNMMKVIGQFQLSELINAVNLLPKFEWNAPGYSGCPVSAPSTSSAASTSSSSSSSSSSSASTQSYVPFSIAVVAGNGTGTPTPLAYTYQNDKLKGAIGITFIVVNNANENIKSGEFTLDTDLGIITRTNPFMEGDVLIVPTFFKYM